MRVVYRKTLALTGAAGLAAGLTYLLDSQSGRRRRARLRDQSLRLLRRTGRTFGMVAADVNGRSHALPPKLKRILAPDRHVDDSVLTERVRSRMGHYASHPHSLEVESKAGVVTLRGPILERESADVIAQVRRVPGVRELVNGLEPHAAPEGIAGLRGASRRNPHGIRFGKPWSPTLRLSALLAGTGLLFFGLRRGPRGWLAAALGIALGTRALFNRAS